MALNNGNNNNYFNTDDSDYLPSSSNPEDINVYTAGNEEQEGQISLSSFLEAPKEETDDKPEIVKKITNFVGKYMPKKSMHSATKKGAKWQRLGRIALTVFLVGIITCGIGIGTVVAWLANEDAKGTFDMEGYDLNGSLDFTSTIYVKNEKGDYEEYQRLHGMYNRIWVYDENMPDTLENAFVAIEDKRFKTHAGVDWKRTVSAFINSFVNIYGERQGGSTITQQLVKNITSDNDVSAMRKVREIMRARYLENNYSKDSILEWYLNTIPMGNGIYGVEVAANYYFGKTVEDLTIAECASLASITKNPEYLRPDIKKNEEEHLERRNTVLKEMLSQKHITKEQYEKAVKTELKVVANSAVLNAETNNNSYFVDALIDDVVQMLVTKKGYDKDVAEQEVYNGGYKIYSTLDLKAQETLEKVYKTESYFSAPVSSTDGKTTPQSAMTIMDYEGHIVGIIGGKGEREGSRILNRATSSPRQVGSSMKPIGVYALATEYNEITYSSFLDDRQMSWTDPSVKGGWPNNYDFSYRGKVSTEYAIYHSVNCTPVHVLRNIIGNGLDNYEGANNGLEISYDFLTSKLGLNHLTEEDKTFSSLCLGGCVYGATTEEMAAAYAVFGNLGYYYKPTTFTMIYDQFDNVVYDNSKEKPIMAISEDTATVMNHLLQQVVKKGTGAGAEIKNFDVFAKTGTTTDSQDLWFVGGTPHYVAACWYGFDEPLKYSPNGMSGNFNDGTRVSAAALRIWKEVMSEIHEDLPEKEFVDSEYAEKLKYCTQTGLIAKGGCPKTAKGWYRADNIPESCNKHGNKKKTDKDKDDDKKDSKKDSSSESSSSKKETSSKKEETASAETESKKEEITETTSQ